MRVPAVRLFIITAVLFAGVLALSACSGQDTEKTPKAQNEAAVAAVHTEIAAPAPEEPEAQEIAEVPEALAATPTPAPDLADYEGDWSDTEFNQNSGCNTCGLFLNYNLDSEPVPMLSLIVYDGDRLIDFLGEYELAGDTGTFLLEDGEIKGTGTFHLGAETVTLQVELASGDETLAELFSKERTLVRDPYQGLVREDPIELVVRYVQEQGEDPQQLTYQLDTGAEWNEEMLGGEEVEIVDGVDPEGVIVSSYIVNTLNASVEDLSDTEKR
ncbi:hypothetical protein GCM10010912_31080 [Paenibacillus albidus]|uniref:Uncharacterized protein n=1 Tax=Paenibacillus albidus TaxID=2041023 RepID=A0A917FIC6_9BACL|nr:hypothetical protein [Paenibacillus albidus]GGF83703.1 hypothetical protein GCM10010912_31080 [Paenibacillus albidus]